MDQKGLKMYEKKQKMELSDLKYLLFSERERRAVTTESQRASSSAESL